MRHWGYSPSSVEYPWNVVRETHTGPAKSSIKLTCSSQDCHHNCKWHWLLTWRLSRANASIEVQAAVLQNAIALEPHPCASLQLVQKAQTLRMLDSERWEATVVQGNIFPDVALQVEHSDMQVVILHRCLWPTKQQWHGDKSICL